MRYLYYSLFQEVISTIYNEEIIHLPLNFLHPFPAHPFQVRDDEAMRETVESIKEYGVLVPIIVRPREEGGYEIISGHRRKRACELAGIETIPAVIRNIDRDTATIFMCDSNLQRENILPSERAAAYKMKMEAIKRRAGRPSKENASQVETHKRSDEIIAEQTGESRAQIQRYIRLTELQPELQQMVDDKKIAMTPAVEISYLKPEEQRILLTTIESEQATPSLSQAQRMKKLSQSGELTEDTILDIMMEQKKPERTDLTIPADILLKYFPRSYTPQQIQKVIEKLLAGWQRKRQQNHER